MAPQKNLALIFSKVPTAFPKPGEDLTIQDLGYDPSAPAPEDGLVLELLYASFDPYLRGLLRPADVKSYFPALPLNKPIMNACLAKVLKSNIPSLHEGDTVTGRLPFVQYAVLSASDLKSLGGPPQKLDVEAGPPDLRDWLGALGMPGLTAYSSFYEIGAPKKGETIFVSSAAGAVGQLVGQLAKHEGLTVIGSVGTDDKLDFITSQVGYDAGFNYKKESYDDALKRLAPQGVDIYFEKYVTSLSSPLPSAQSHSLTPSFPPTASEAKLSRRCSRTSIAAGASSPAA